MFDLVSPATGLNWSLEADLCGFVLCFNGIGFKVNDSTRLYKVLAAGDRFSFRLGAHQGFLAPRAAEAVMAA